MAVDSKDRVLVGGIVNNNEPVLDDNSGWMLVRFRADGSLDTGFGEGGLARAPGLFGENLAMNGQEIRALAVVPGSDKVIAGGLTLSAGNDSDFTIARYNADGSLDMSFGPADTGFVKVDLGSKSDSLEDIAVSADGSITAVGYSGLDAGLARWDSDGVLDPSFDGPGGIGNGKFVDSVSATTDDYRSLEVGPAGEVRAVGLTANGADSNWLVGSYTATGARNTAFNGTGVQVVSFGTGSDVAAGQALVDGLLYVFGNADIDPTPITSLSFGVDAFRVDDGAEVPGVKKFIVPPQGRNVHGAALQLIGGSTAPADQRFLIAGGGSTLLRLRRIAGNTAALEVDTEFGSDGYAPQPPVNGPPVTGSWADVTTDSQNRAVVGGEVGIYETADFTAGRYIDTAPPFGQQSQTRDTVSPVLSNVSVSPRAWALDPRGSVEALLSKKKKAQRGTKIRYTLSEPAGVVVRVERRRVKKKGKKKKVTFASIGSFAKSGKAGANENPFSGRMGARKLRPGSYRATLVATDSAGNSSKPALVTFKVVRP